MSVDIYVARAENEGSAELKRVLSEAMLPVTGRCCTLARTGVIRSKQVQKIAFSKPDRLICEPLLVDEQRKGQAGFVAE